MNNEFSEVKMVKDENHVIINAAKESRSIRINQLNDKEYDGIQKEIKDFLEKNKGNIGDFDFEPSKAKFSSSKFKGYYFSCKLTDYIQEKLKDTQYRIINVPAFIKGYENYEFDALITNKDSKPVGIYNYFELKDVIAVLEYKLRGIYFRRKSKNNKKANLVQTFAKCIAVYKHLKKNNLKLKFIYISASESNPKEGEVHFFDISKKIFDEFGIDSFILADSRTIEKKEVRYHTWKGEYEKDRLDKYLRTFRG